MSYVIVKNSQTGEILYDSVEENRKAWLELQEKRQMSNIVPKDFTKEQLELITNTIAKGATPDELKLFLYRCKHLGLDPLKPGQIYFIKYGNSPGTIVVGIEGLRAKAISTGKYAGVSRGVVRDEKGTAIGAWCEVRRTDWAYPAREEVSLKEYSTGKGNWTKLPEAMIKKVAEASALRMAFPDDLGGLYSSEEMDQAKEEHHGPNKLPGGGNGHGLKVNYSTPTLPSTQKPLDAPGEYVVAFGKKYKGQAIKNIDPEELAGFITWCEEQAGAKGLPLSFDAMALKINFDALMAEGEFMEEMTSQPKFEDWDRDDNEQIPF